MNRFTLWLNEQKYGEATYVVEIAEIEVQKHSFRSCEDEKCAEGIDRDALEKYGIATMAARAFCAQRYFVLTSNGNSRGGNLLCGRASGPSDTIKAKIVIDRNLDFLTGSFISMEEDSKEDQRFKFLTRCFMEMRDGRAIASVEIPDFFPAKGQHLVNPGSFSIRFLGEPVEIN